MPQHAGLWAGGGALDRRLRRVGREAKRIGKYMLPYAANVGVSTASFHATLLAHEACCYALGISCATPALAPALGFLSVGVSSAAAGQAALHLERCLRGSKAKAKFRWEHPVADAAAGLVFFKVLGGRFRNVMPSHLLFPGAFASQSLLAAGKNYATGAQKVQLRGMLARHGCHTCGKTHGPTKGDHQPPNKLVHRQAYQSGELSRAAVTKAGVKAAGSLAAGKPLIQAVTPVAEAVDAVLKSPWTRSLPQRLKAAATLPAAPRSQRFYPQCAGCSSRQGALLSGNRRVSSRQHLVLHLMGPRSWILAGGLTGLQYHTHPQIEAIR